jgi:flagellar hook assembly protein FlgD
VALAAFPNPFSASTRIRFEIPSLQPVSVRLFDLNGRLVRRLEESAHLEGVQEWTWDGRDDAGRPVTSGVYFYQVVGETFRATRKLVRTE